MKEKNPRFCPRCSSKLVESDLIKCGSCNWVVGSSKERWKEANMGKQRAKPVANRTGKKNR